MKNKQTTNSPIRVQDRPILYDWLYSDYTDDISMFIRIATDHKADVLLECGIGTGRIAIPLAKQGFTVYGIDNSEKMLERLNGKLKSQEESIRGRVHPMLADMRNFDLGRTFPIIYVPFSTFNYLLTREDQKSALQSFLKHLADDGILVLEVLGFSYQKDWLIKSQRKVSYHIKKGHGLFGYQKTEARRENAFDSSTQIAKETRYFYYFDDGVRKKEEYIIWENRFFLMGELESLLELTGYKDIKVYGDYGLTRNYEHEDKFPVVIARK